MGTILCVDGEPAGRRALACALGTLAPLSVVGSAAAARTALGRDVAVVVSADRLPDADGPALLAEVRARDATIGRLLLLTCADARVLLAAINRGRVHHCLARDAGAAAVRAAVAGVLAEVESARARAWLAEPADPETGRRMLAAARMRFVTLAAHELRTPLHVAAGTLEALASEPLPAAVAPLLAVARRNLGWLGRHVAALGELARLAGVVPPRRLPLCLGALVRAVAEEAAPLFAQRRLVLRCDAPDRLPARAAPDGIRHALMSLLVNAIRFTPDGGAVELRLRRRAATAVFSVHDTGIGMPAAIRARIGEPFVTGGDVDRHHGDPIAFRARGLGLGLAVASGIAREHGGRLWVERAPEGGTIVHLAIAAPLEEA